MNTDNSLDLMRVDILGLGEDGREDTLVIFHVEFLGLEELIHVIDPHPEVLLLVQVVQVGFLRLAKGQKDLLHPYLVLGQNFIHHLISEFVETSRKNKQISLTIEKGDGATHYPC